MSIGERLREARHRLNISQRELARRAGISHPIVQALEAGISRDVGHAKLTALADVLEVSLDWLIHGTVEDDYGISDDDPEYQRAMRLSEMADLKHGPVFEAARRFFKREIARRRRELEGGREETFEPAGRLSEEERAG